MLRYEVLILAVPEITADETNALEEQLSKLLQNYKDQKAALVSFDRWGKYLLAYPVRKNDYGIYFLARVSCEDTPQLKDLLNAIRDLYAIKFDEVVMRHVIVCLDSARGLEYQRPDSLEEAPSRDVDSFLKENKMTGLLAKNKHGEEKQSARDSAEGM